MGELLCLASVGRSGSTLLQRLLNTHPEIVLFGEHEGFLSGMRAAYARLTAPRTVALIDTGRRYLGSVLGAEPVASTPGGWSMEWTNALRPRDAATAFAGFVKDLIYPPEVRSPSHRYWGFKEIRYGIGEIEFLGSIFRGGRFLVLARNPVAVYRSQCRLGWGGDKGAEQAAAEFHHAFSALADAWDALRCSREMAGRARMVCYERLVRRPLQHLELIAGWLEIAPFPEAEAVATANAHLTPGGRRWTPEMGAFLDAYLGTYAEEDLKRYSDMLAGASDAGIEGARSAAVAGGRGDVWAAADSRSAMSAPTAAALPRVDLPALAADVAAGSPVPLRRERQRGKPSRRRKLVFLHMPSTGGTTLHDQVASAFDASEIYPHRFGLREGCSAEELDGYSLFSGHFSFDAIQRIPGEKYVFTLLRDPRERLLSLCRLSPCRLGPWRGPWLADAGDETRPNCANGPERLAPPRPWTGSRGCAFKNDMARRLAGPVVVAADGTYLKRERGAWAPVEGAEVVRLALANLGRIDCVGFTERLDAAYAQVAHDCGLPQAAGALPLPDEALAGHGTAQEVTPVFEAELNRLTDLDRAVFDMAWSVHADR